MEKMSTQETRDFLLSQPRTGKLASVRADGRPHVTPIWFDLDGDEIVFMTWHESVKAKNITHSGKVSICVDEEAPPYAYVIMEGTAKLTRPDDMLYWSTRISGRYMGEDLAEAYGKRNAVEGEMLVRMTVTKTMAFKGIAD